MTWMDYAGIVSVNKTREAVLQKGEDISIETEMTNNNAWYSSSLQEWTVIVTLKMNVHVMHYIYQTYHIKLICTNDCISAVFKWPAFTDMKKTA